MGAGGVEHSTHIYQGSAKHGVFGVFPLLLLLLFLLFLR